jgi:integrase/recombinase XerD
MGKRRKGKRNIFWKSGSWYGRKKIAGKDHKFSLRTDDEGVAKERLKAEIASLIARTLYSEGRTTWDDAAVNWRREYVRDRDISDRTVTRYLCSLRQMEPWLLGRFVDRGQTIRSNGIDAALVSEIVAGRRAKDATTATIKRDLVAMASVLTYCQQEGLRSDNPALDRLRLLVERRDPIVLPDAADIEHVIARLPGMLAALTRAARATGCRQAELVNARRANLNHERKELTVIGKGNKLRVIDLAPFGGYDLLRALPAYVGSPYLFWHGKGEPYRNLSSRFAAIVKQVAKCGVAQSVEHRAVNALVGGSSPPAAANFRPFRFHHLRHLHAVEWLRAGYSIYDLQQRLGHASITTTEGYLKFLTPDQVRAAKMARSA